MNSADLLRLEAYPITGAISKPLTAEKLMPFCISTSTAAKVGVANSKGLRPCCRYWPRPQRRHAMAKSERQEFLPK